LELIDTHTHLYDQAFDGDRKEVVNRAIQNGISKVILPDIDSTSRDSMEKLASEFPGFAHPTIGLHPTSVGIGWERELEMVLDGIDNNKHIAIGEIGIDCYWSKEFVKEQIVVFEKQLEAASQAKLPVIIHSRDATELILDSIKRLKHLDLKGVFHAFSGSLETYRQIKALGNFMFGIGGVVTFKNSKLPATVLEMDKNSLILETDAPWLTPTPLRGKRNEPAHVQLIAKKIAEIKKCDIKEIAQTTTTNANRLFKFII
jgi:TatD DNase family protein